MISILVLVFAMILLGEQIKLKKDVRRLEKLMKHLKSSLGYSSISLLSPLQFILPPSIKILLEKNKLP